MATNRIPCTFSLLTEGRKYTGQHRKYLIENAREICYSPATRERIKLREALGYYGHGRRVLCKKMNLQEVDVITLPDGTQAMVSNVPSNVTVKFDVAEDGTVTHEQEILDTETGKIVSGLHASRVGGFSWACPGEDGGRTATTRLKGFSGFDYVLQPGFAMNRGYVLESAQGIRDQVLESVSAVVGDDVRAEQLVAGWQFSYHSRIHDLEDMVFESESELIEVREQYRNVQRELVEAVSRKSRAEVELENFKKNFKGVLESVRENFPFFIPEAVMHEMMNGDLTRAKAIFESASEFDFTSLPVREATRKSERIVLAEGRQIEKPDFGSAGYGFTLKV